MKQKVLINHGLQCLLFALLMLTPLGSWAEDYPITVAGIQVTSENASNITGDGKVSFTPADNETGTPATLTLGDYDLSINHGDAIVTDISPLRIFLAGTSAFFCYDGCVIRGTKEGANISVTFTTDETTIDDDQEIGGSLSFPLTASFSGVDVHYENVSLKKVLDYCSIDSRYLLKVGGTEVTYFNKDNILGDGTASFAPANNSTSPATPAVLTLNGADIEGGILWYKYDNLAIALNGVNSIANTQGYTIECSTDENYDKESEPSPTLIFTKADGATSCRLTLSGNIGGFGNNQYVTPGSGLFYIKSETTATVTSTILGGGSGADEDHAIIIRNKDDFKDFISYVNNGTLTTEYVKLNANIEYTSSEEFNPIGSPDFPFMGHFDGNNKTISGILYESDDEGASVGMFESVGSEAYAGSVKKLTLSNCSFSGGQHVGAIAGELGDGTIKDCTVTSCTVRSGAAESPNVGGVVGMAYPGCTIQDCTVSSCTISSTITTNGGVLAVGGIVGNVLASTMESGEGDGVTIWRCVVNGTENFPTTISSSHIECYAGGIVGTCDGLEYYSTISDCSVKGMTTVMSVNTGESGGAAHAGAIVGSHSNTLFTNNHYEYSVTTQTTDGFQDPLIKEGYEQRGTGMAIYIQNETYYDIEENDGAVLYTKKLTMPEDSQEGTVELELEEEYYAKEGNVILIAPGQPVMLTVTPGENLFVSAISVTYGTDQTAEIELTQMEDGVYFYTINEMPDADATVNVTYEQIEDYGISVAGVDVTNANANNIFWDNDDIGGEFALASYDYSTNTLTMNGLIGTEISGGANGFVTVYNGAESLNVNLIGYNKVGDNFEHLFSAESPCTINLTTGAIPGELEYFGGNVTNEKVTLAYGNSGLTLKKEGNITTIESSNGTEDICYFGTGAFYDDGSSLDENYPTHDYSRYEWYYSNAVKTNNNGYLAPTVISSEGVSKMRPSQGTDLIGSLIFQCVPVVSEAAITVKLMSLNGETEYATGTLTDGVVTLIPSPAGLATFENVCLTFSSTAPFSFVPMAVKTEAIVPESSFEFHNGWTTYYNADADIFLPANVAAYIVTGVGANTAIVSQIKYVPKGIPVLLNQQNESVASTDNINTSNNMLFHATEPVNVSTLEGTAFGLYNGSFMRVTGSISVGKNYLYIPNATVQSGAPRLNIVFENDGNMTGISDAKRGNDSRQSVEWYTLEGQKLQQEPVVKGLYIKNGKKVVVNNK